MNTPPATNPAERTGVVRHDPAAVQPGYVLFTGGDGVTRLIDRSGTVLRSWPHPGLPPRIVDPATTGSRRGDIVLQLSANDDPRGGIFSDRTIGQLTWQGDVVWEWGHEAPGGSARQNHDWQILPDGRRLLLVAVPRPVPGLSSVPLGDQGLFEIAADGRVLWTWLAGDHLDELGLSTAGMQWLRETVEQYPDDPWGFLEMNSATTVGPNPLYDADPSTLFQPENILVSFRKANVVALVERTSGRIVWRLGPDFGERPGDQHVRIRRRDLPRPVDQLSGQHNPHLIAPGLPGAGHILLFDNQGGAGYPPAPLGIYAGSRVLEIDPATRQIVWQYTAEDSGLPPWEFFSSFVGNAQRLPNGDTLITEGMRGRLFEVSRDGRIVWDYRSPFHSGGARRQDGDHAATPPPIEAVTASRLVYRSQFVPSDWVPDPRG